MMCSASASASAEAFVRIAHQPDAAARQFRKAVGGVSTRMPGRKPDSGNTETARPDSTAAATALALALV